MPVTPQLRAHVAFVLATAGVVGLLVLTGCGRSATAPAASVGTATGSATASAAVGGSSATTPSTQTNAQGERLYTPAYVPNGHEIAIIKTSKGTIRVQLHGKDAPINTANFIELSRKGFYNGVRFHRLEPGFVLQGGDPQTKKLSKKRVIKLVGEQKRGVYAQGEPMLGTGGPGYVVKGEFDPNNIVHKHIDGTLAAARTDDPDSAGSQFYFALVALPELDGRYTVFGDTIKGLSVVHALGIGDVIDSITIQNMSK